LAWGAASCRKSLGPWTASSSCTRSESRPEARN